jgi:cation diffusion facilitator family transporter
MTGNSRGIVLLSLAANLAIALSKLTGALFTASTALLAEAVHSFADCGNQLLLLYGQTAASKSPDRRFPLGYGREAFFWSFLVALLLFSMGGIYSLYEGYHKIASPQPIRNPFIGILILLVAICFESAPFIACIKKIRKEIRFLGIWRWMKNTTNTDLLVIFLEDSAAILGSSIALVFISLSIWTNSSYWDGVGSMVIGGLLITVAIILGKEIKALLVGEAPSYNYRSAVEEIVTEIAPSMRVLRFIALQVGINQVMVAYKLHPGRLKSAKSLIDIINQIEEAVKEAYPEIKWQFVEPDYHA